MEYGTEALGCKRIVFYLFIYFYKVVFASVHGTLIIYQLDLPFVGVKRAEIIHYYMDHHITTAH